MITKDLLKSINLLIRPLRTQIANVVSRAVISLVDDTTKAQSVQLGILDGETRADIERFQEYGFTSVPAVGAEAVAVFVNGRRDHGIVVGVEDRRYRLKNLQPGEVAVYDKTGSSIVLKANGDIEVTPSSGVLNLVGNSDAVALASKVNARCAAIENLLKGWTTVSGDGGAALKTAATTALASPASTASTKVKTS